MIAIIDYGLGNLFSLSASLESIGAKYIITKNIGEIEAADKIILPGVGAFGDAMAKLNEENLVTPLISMANQGKPIMGICLGMQLLFDKSYEYGEHTGLGLLKGEVKPLKDDLKSGLKVPHMGWNELDIIKESPILKYNKTGDYVYYVHSFYATGCEDCLIATSPYEVDVAGVVGSKNVFGTQFHPEKSGDVGLKILKAYEEMK